MQITSVDPTNRTLSYTTLPGRTDPASLTAPATIPVKLWAVAFRDRSIVPGTSRMQVAAPIAPGVLALVQDHTPWTQSATLATLRPGDTVVVTQRGGSPAVIVTRGDGITISRGLIYGGSGIALLLNTVSNSTVERVIVAPRPGNLTASNADGIHFIDAGQNDHIRNCFVTGTLDDALVMDSYDIATTLAPAVAGARQLTVQRTAYAHFPNGTTVNFIDPVSARELTGATIVSQIPPDASPPVLDGTVVLTLDRPLPALAIGTGMIFAAASQRGEGSSIEENAVGEVPFGRGVWIGGCEGVTVQDNNIGSTSNGGIAVYEGVNSYPTPPAHAILIRRNVVEGSLGPMASGSGTQIALGAIMVDSVNNANAFPAASPNTNISILDNLVLSSGRTGIWVAQVDGGDVRNNAVIGYDLYPDLPLFGVNAAESAQLPLEFAQPFVLKDDEAVGFSDDFDLR